MQDVTFALGHLGVESFYVVGVSGGGPYALACAAFRSDMVKGVMLISAAGNPGTVWPAVPQCNCHTAAGAHVQCMQPSCDHRMPSRSGNDSCVLRCHLSQSGQLTAQNTAKTWLLQAS